MFECRECGKKFKTTKAAEKAMWNGCPKCNGSDIDIARDAIQFGKDCIIVPKQ